MLRARIIPALLIKNNGLVKTIKFSKPSYVGDPINVVRIFNEKEVDEMLVLDICASKKNKDPNYDLIKKIASECFMPLTYGGGIKTFEQAKKIFSFGVEKICLQTSVLENMDILRQISGYFGAQSVVISVDIKKNWRGKPSIYSSVSGKIVNSDIKEHVQDLISSGAGEILLNSVDKDGTLEGPDLDLIQSVGQYVNVPLISLGGISSLDDIKDSIKCGADAVAAGSFFVYHGTHRAVLISYPKYSDLEDLLRQ